jgi:GntR family transcriptional regulator
MHTTINGENRFKITPLYIQAQERLTERIRSCEWKPGFPLPNEGALAAEYGVSSGTMRKALDALEAEGVLIRRQGKGTFVSEHRDWDALSDDAKSLLAAIGAVEPSDKPRDRSVVAAADTYTSEDLRAFSRGATEIAAWLDRRAHLKQARAAA